MKILRNLALFCLAALALNTVPVSAQNAVAIGKAAKVSGTVQVPVNYPADFNWKTSDDIMKMRKRAVMANKALLQDGEYVPSLEVFGALEDRKPWWGLAGACVFGPGMNSIQGLSEESRFILNPWLLVALNSNARNIWYKSKITKADIQNPHFPFQWMPESIRWAPKQSKIHVVYDVSKWGRDVAATGKAVDNANLAVTQFSLVAYNAKDFGFNYVQLDNKASQNVVNDHKTEFPTQIRQFIHCGGTCHYPGGCNNMSPFTPQIDRMRFTKLPARAVVGLWQQSPAHFGDPPDLQCIIDIK